MSMGREQMRNLETFKIGGTQVNEFEYQKNQGQLTEQHEQHTGEGDTSKPLSKAERVKQVMADAHKKVEKRKKKETGKTPKKKAATKRRSN
jgi:hypothetical protein